MFELEFSERNSGDQALSSKWILGPEFLWKEEKQWPEAMSGEEIIAGKPSEQDPEVKRVVAMATTTSAPEVTLVDRIAYFSSCNLGQNKWNIWTTPPPISMMPKWRVFGSFAPSSLLWGGWRIIVPFYTVQDCPRTTLALQEAMFAMQNTSDLFSHVR